MSVRRRQVLKDVKLGSRLAEIGRKLGLTDEEFAIFESVRDKTPAKPLRFESWEIAKEPGTPPSVRASRTRNRQ